ncbi:SDR family oxidoreductase [Desmonostoc muscorum LEGE 12446]|uniref:SDR family oxidoreductase n=1 Tax=Desmonostoc muscorum LEGE 12446 TaxID=1828758 RepID=A0A8J6ZR34_DESMC|nr:SDR family oxidoreductase [Desmonostoc muscorum]MCF2146325.1 SDR family oxidoreductase [Desmonostoc muscorum LEGE 12446]
MKTVLITGVTGFIGRYVARQFAEAGWNVVGLGTRPTENAPIQSLSSYHQLTLPANVLADLVQQVQPHVCIHCAARASVNLSVTEPEQDFSASVDVTFNVVNTLRLHAPQCRVIYLSSAAVYGNPQTLPIYESQTPQPISPYGFHRLISEQICTEFFKIYGLPTSIVRIFSAYGPGLRRQVLWDMCHKALTRPILKLQGTGNESRDFIHVRDIAKALYVLAENAPCQAEVHNVASGVETTIKELADIVMANIERKIPIEFDGVIRAGDPLNWKADVTSLTQIGFTPEVNLQRGISVYAQWCRAEVMGW